MSALNEVPTQPAQSSSPIVESPGSSTLSISMSTMSLTVDPLFKDPGADITFCSADGTHFQLQRKFLEANTGAFPGSEFDTRGEVVHLTESDSILRLLFGFVHPRKHPDVEELSFPLLAGVAEAAEKYEVFSAINICKLQMRQFASTNPVEVLAYATKHDHPTLIKETAPHLARLPAIQIVEQLPTRYVLPWLEYRAVWDAIFEDASKAVLAAETANRNKRPTYFASSLVSEACYACKVSMLTTIQELKEMTSVSDLKDALAKPRPPLMTCLTPACAYATMFPRVCQDMKTEIDTLAVFRIPAPLP